MGDEASDGRHKHAREWLTFLVAAMAAVVSVLGYIQSKAANTDATKARKATERSTEREQASLVDFIVWNREGVRTLSIANHTRQTINEVKVIFDDERYLDVGSVPGCVMWYMGPLKTTDEYGEEHEVILPARLDFTDSQDPTTKWTLTRTLDKRKPEPELTGNLTALFSGQMTTVTTAC
ncbi:hypothetical protein [Streptomyces sp. NBC_01092]|uniref:hypothetical protein n=1 Tax=Streptomyces sp. NBC_01092 TaxID=2903748 RepID=UPI00386875BA|nr:hypothetical protein OG254_08605 [Streptomyces sp. NBC_01092]